MKTLSLFRQKPQVKKFRPSPQTRLVGSIDLDRKGELERFKKWLIFVGKQKSDLPSEDEIKKLEKESEVQSKSGFNIGSIISAIPSLLPGLGGLIGAAGLGLGTLAGIGGGVGGILKGLLKRPFSRKTRPRSKNKVPNKQSSRPPRPGQGGRPRVTQSGGGRAGRRPDIRNPLRERPRVSGSGGGRVGRPDIRNPFRQRPTITQGVGGTGKFSIQRLLRRLPKNTLQRLTGTLTRKFLTGAGGLLRRIPIIGGLIDFAVRYFIFKDPIGKAALQALTTTIGGALGAALGTIGGLGVLSWVVGPAGALLGSMAGDKVGEWIWNAFFQPKAGQKPPEGEFKEEDYEEELEQMEDYEDQSADSSGPISVDNLKDSSGRPIKLVGPAAASFKRMAKDAADKGLNIGRGISSSYRTRAENTRVGGHKNSAHLYGEAFDINWYSPEGIWIRQNAKRYGFRYNSYSNTSTHFDWTGSRAGNVRPVEGITRASTQKSATTSEAQLQRDRETINMLEAVKNIFSPKPTVEPEPKPATPEVAMSSVPKDQTVARYTPEAEMVNEGNVIVISQAPTQQPAQSTGTSQIVPFPVGGSGGGQSTVVAVGLLNSLDDLMLTKLDNA